MSHLDETPKVLPVNVNKTALMALQTGQTWNSRHPVVGVWTNILDHSDHIVTSQDLPQGVPTYEVYDIQSVTDDVQYTAVKLLFRRPGSQAPDPLSVVDDHNMTFEMIVPVQDLAVVQALRMSPEHCFFAVFDPRHSDPSVDRAAQLREMLIALVLPPVDSIESDEISEKMTQLISDSFTTPFSPVSEEEDSSGVPLSLRKAQSFLLATLAGLSFGDEVSFRRLLRMEEWFTEYAERATGRSEDTSTDDADHVAFISAVVHLLRIVMMRSSMNREDVETENPEISPLGSSAHDDEFLSIMKHSEIDKELRRIGSSARSEGTELLRFSSQAATVQKPFADGWPESMRSLEDHPALSGRKPFWELDFNEEVTDDDSEASDITDSDFAEVMTAFALIIAARAARLAEVRNVNNEIEGRSHPTLPLVQWLTADDDFYMWELAAMGPLVEDYETLQFSDLLNFSTTPSQDPHDALYFNLTVHTIAHQFLEEKWTSQTFTEALSQLDVQFPDAKQVAVHLLDDLVAYSLEDDNDDDSPCVAAKATYSLGASGIPLENLSLAVARLVPTMADVQAHQNQLPVGDEEWKNFRKRYIRDLLGSVAASTSRRFPQ